MMAKKTGKRANPKTMDGVTSAEFVDNYDTNVSAQKAAEQALITALKDNAYNRSKLAYYEKLYQKKLDAIKEKITDDSDAVSTVRTNFGGRQFSKDQKEWESLVSSVRTELAQAKKFKPPKKNSTTTTKRKKQTRKQILEHIVSAAKSLGETFSWSDLGNKYKELSGSTLQQKEKITELRVDLTVVADGNRKLFSRNEILEDINSAIEAIKSTENENGGA